MDQEPTKSGIKQVKRDKKGRFVKGCSGNPEGGPGRPEGSVSVTTAIRNKLAEVPKGKKRTYLELLITKILTMAIGEGNTRMIKLIWNYIDGKPTERQEIIQRRDKLDILLGEIRERREPLVKFNPHANEGLGKDKETRAPLSRKTTQKEGPLKNGASGAQKGRIQKKN